MLEVLTDDKFAELPRDEEGQIVSARKMWTPGFREEVPDQTPLAIPVNMQSPETLEQTMLRLIQLQKFRDAGFDAAFETEEEANDFVVEESETAISGLQVMTMLEDNARESKVLEPKGGEGNVVTRNANSGNVPEAGGASGTLGNSDAGRATSPGSNVEAGNSSPSAGTPA